MKTHMKVSDLINRLAELQIEQDDIIQELANRANNTEHNTEANVENKDKKSETQENDTEIRIGDHVLLLTSGRWNRKGDKAQVTKVTSSEVHFTILRNNHATYKKHRNVRKIQQT